MEQLQSELICHFYPNQQISTGKSSPRFSFSLSLKALSYAEDPFASFATNKDNFTSGASPVGLQVVGSDNETVEYKAESKTNFSSPYTIYDMEIEGGSSTVSHNFEISEQDSFLKVISLIKQLCPLQPISYSLCPTNDDHRVIDRIVKPLF